METAGRIIFSLCLGVFFIFDVLGMTDPSMEVKYFDLKFLFITVGLIITSTVYQIDMNKNKFSELSKKGQLTKKLTYFSIIMFYSFLLFNGIKYYNKWIVKFDLLPLYLSAFYRLVLVAIISFGLGYILSKMKAIFDRVVRTYYYLLCIIEDLICVYVLLFLPVFSHDTYGFITLKYFSVGILIIYNVFVLFNIRSLIIKYLRYKNKNYEYYPLIMGIILMANITSLMVVQFNLDHLNLLLSFAYLALAVTYIIYGFKQRFLFIRYFGLVLTIFALTKLFFWDLRSLEESGRIIAYFGFGFILLIISYIYQQINKKMNKEISEKV